MLRKTREIGARATEGTGGEAVELETRFLLRSFWESTAGFWGKRGTRASWVLSGILLLIVVGNLVDSYGMNVWSRVIFDALEKRDSATVLELSILYSRLLAGSVFLTVLQLWARMTMQRRWREWLNKRLIDRWLKNGRYYQFNLVGSVHKNPECRIADDVWIATEAPVEFAAGATSAVLSADMRAGAKLLVLPQRPYLPIGTLRRAATYPEAAESRSVEPVAKVLEKVELGYLVERVDEDGLWDETLSGGEKQRLAFARLLLHRPDVIVLDEATAALDTSSQNRVIGRLWQELKDATVVSMGHRPELADFHRRKIVLRRAHGGARLVSDVNSVGDAGDRAGQRRRAERDSRTGRLRDAELAGIPQWA